MAEQKTNVMRLLEQAGAAYKPHTYEWDGKTAPDGATVARGMGVDPGMVFKTLVAKGASGGYYVFDVPVEASLDLKKAAKAAGEKSIEMLHLKELFPLTGYVHGGCSPLGMKKKFPTVFDETCILYDTIYVSAGKIGFQVEAAPGDLIKASEAVTADIITED
jgi:Cys-tRNA(Pro)/Cys-tRNA(Cys) deacylase